MEDIMGKDKKVLENIICENLNSDNWNRFCDENKWIDKGNLERVCRRYGFPDKNELTVVIENYYIDVAFRDVYYHYWSKAHFDWPRHCKRLFLFKNRHLEEEFYYSQKHKDLKEDFLGTIVVRPAYSSETDHTFGRTLLTPYKMSGDTGKEKPFLYLETSTYTFHLLGDTYSIDAFPFCSQDGVVMKCAETAIYEMCEFAAARDVMHSRILPSDIQRKLEARSPERILPSHGLYCNDISYLLMEFGFSPMIYAESINGDKVTDVFPYRKARIGSVSGSASEVGRESYGSKWDSEHITDLKKWFHYYVESGIPLLTITAPNQETIKHAALVIGHGKKRKSVNDCRIYRLGGLPCMDTAELYEDYIVQDDNQVPYVEEKMDRFTSKNNYKLDAFIVPLERHVFLEAASAVDICDVFIEQENLLIRQALKFIRDAYVQRQKTVSDYQMKADYDEFISGGNVDDDNPVTVRYFLTNSAEYKRYRIYKAETMEDKRFYAEIPMPKSVWIAEISSYKWYEEGYAFSEIVLDATASNRTQADSIILLRAAHFGVYRLPDETYEDFRKKMLENKCCSNLSAVFDIYSNYRGKEMTEVDS